MLVSVLKMEVLAQVLRIFEDPDNGTNKVTLIGPASTADVTPTLSQQQTRLWVKQQQILKQQNTYNTPQLQPPVNAGGDLKTVNTLLVSPSP